LRFELSQIYHIKYNPPKDEEIAKRMIQRADDTLEVLKNRMVEYQQHLQPIMDGFGKWLLVDSGQDKHQVVAKIEAYIDEKA
jgi:adenylate kinase